MKTLLRNISLLVFLTIYPLYNFANEISAHDYAAKVHDDIIQIIQTKNALYIEDPDKFTKEISEAFSPIVDFNRIARNVMGKHYKKSTNTQRIAFAEAFKASLLDTYSGTLVEFKDEKIVVLPPENTSKSKNKAKVKIEIITSSSIYPGTYSMYLDKEGKWKIINIVVNGINLGKTFRSQFYSLMEKNEENINLVIDQWIASV